MAMDLLNRSELGQTEQNILFSHIHLALYSIAELSSMVFILRPIQWCISNLMVYGNTALCALSTVDWWKVLSSHLVFFFHQQKLVSNILKWIKSERAASMSETQSVRNSW